MRAVGGLLFLGWLLLSGRPAAAQAPTPAGPQAEAVPLVRDDGVVENLMEAAEQALDAGRAAEARALFERIVAEHPESAAASEARRALKIFQLQSSQAPAPPAASGGNPPLGTGPGGVLPPAGRAGIAAPPVAADPDTILRLDPYSRRTSERVRISTWEKLDFGITSFLYGMSVGASFAVSQDDSNEVLAPMVFGALAYTAGSVAYLNLAEPDRGDLPLALAITSYVPTTTLLASNLLFPRANAENAALAVAGAGILAVPAAIWATSKLDLDPGDAQLVRDAGFWGMVLAATSTYGFGTRTVTRDYGMGFLYEEQDEPDGRTVAAFALGGLFGGLGLGALTASNTEISLERVRVTTWGGYGGALVGGLLAASGSNGGNDEHQIFSGLAIGAAVGLTVAFLSTGRLDGIPPETNVVQRWLPRDVTPMVMAARAPSGDLQALWGFAAALR